MVSSEPIRKGFTTSEGWNTNIALSFTGSATVRHYRDLIEVIDRLGVAESQRKATLRDGQDAGELLLDIEERIGNLIPDKGENLKDYPRKGGKTIKPVGSTPTGTPVLTKKRRSQAKKIAKHPDIVAKIKAQAREKDIPTLIKTGSVVAGEPIRKG